MQSNCITYFSRTVPGLDLQKKMVMIHKTVIKIKKRAVKVHHLLLPKGTGLDIQKKKKKMMMTQKIVMKIKKSADKVNHLLFSKDVANTGIAAVTVDGTEPQEDDDVGR